MKMRLVHQEHADGCGVAAFAMLTGRGYAEAAKVLRFESGGEDGDGVHFVKLRRALEEDGCFCRSVVLRSEVGDGSWPPHPFAPRHFACVMQPSGNGHYVVMDHLGVVLDPLRSGLHRLDEWDVISEVCGVLG